VAEQNHLGSFVRQHLTELVADLERDGQAAAELLNAAAADVIAAYAERERVAPAISAMATMLATAVHPEM
jgi:hypothetical protein